MDPIEKITELASTANRSELDQRSEALSGWTQGAAHTAALNRYLMKHGIESEDDLKEILPPSSVPLTSDIRYIDESAQGRAGGYNPATNTITVNPDDPYKKATLLHELGHNYDMVNSGFTPKSIDRKQMALKGLSNAESAMSGHSQGRDIFEKQALFELLRSGHLRAPNEIPARNYYLTPDADTLRPKYTNDPSIPRY